MQRTLVYIILVISYLPLVAQDHTLTDTVDVKGLFKTLQSDSLFQESSKDLDQLKPSFKTSVADTLSFKQKGEALKNLWGGPNDTLPGQGTKKIKRGSLADKHDFVTDDYEKRLKEKLENNPEDAGLRKKIEGKLQGIQKSGQSMGFDRAKESGIREIRDSEYLNRPDFETEKQTINELVHKKENIVQELDTASWPTGESVDRQIDQKVARFDETGFEGDKAVLLNQQNQLKGYKGYSPDKLMSKETAKGEIAKRLQSLQLKGGYAGQVSTAQKSLSTYKGRVRHLESVKDMTKSKKIFGDAAFKERVIPGGNFQFHRGNPFGIDISPQLTFKVNQRIYTGFGLTYRAGVTGDLDHFFSRDKEIYGGRVYAECLLFKGIFAHLQYENVRKGKTVDRFLDLWDDKDKEWVSSGFVGINKRYNIKKRFKGNVQFLYNFLFDSINSPYASPLVTRIGFEINPKRK